MSHLAILPLPWDGEKLIVSVQGRLTIKVCRDPALVLACCPEALSAAIGSRRRVITLYSPARSWRGGYTIRAHPHGVVAARRIFGALANDQSCDYSQRQEVVSIPPNTGTYVIVPSGAAIVVRQADQLEFGPGAREAISCIDARR
mgnify:CR=1 FL=1